MILGDQGLPMLFVVLVNLMLSLFILYCIILCYVMLYFIILANTNIHTMPQQLGLTVHSVESNTDVENRTKAFCSAAHQKRNIVILIHSNNDGVSMWLLNLKCTVADKYGRSSLYHLAAQVPKPFHHTPAKCHEGR